MKLSNSYNSWSSTTGLSIFSGSAFGCSISSYGLGDLIVFSWGYLSLFKREET